MNDRPLVAVTRAEPTRGAFAVALERRGAAVLRVPVVSAAPADDPWPLEAALQSLDRFDWLVLTSGRAVSVLVGRGLLERLERPGGPPRVAAVGPATAGALGALGIVPDLVAEEPGAAGLLRALADAYGGKLRGVRVLWPRSDVARPDLRDGLAAAGAVVSDPVAYRTVPAAAAELAPFLRLLAARRVAAVTFLSPSAAEGLSSGLDGGLASLAGRALVASIGPTTSAALRALGAPPDVEAETRTADGLAEALMARLRAGAGLDAPLVKGGIS